MGVRSRFKGLDMVDREPDELWMEVHDIVQETGSNTIPKKKKCKRAKWLAVGKWHREGKGKGNDKGCIIKPDAPVDNWSWTSLGS